MFIAREDQLCRVAGKQSAARYLPVAGQRAGQQQRTTDSLISQLGVVGVGVSVGVSAYRNENRTADEEFPDTVIRMYSPIFMYVCVDSLDLLVKAHCASHYL